MLLSYSNEMHRIILKDKAMEVYSSDVAEYLTRLLKQFLMENPDSMSISAPQIGQSFRMFAMRDYYDHSKIIVCKNPSYIKVTDKKEYFVETCDTLPDYKATVGRYEVIKVKWTDEDNNIQKRTLLSYQSALFQHEMDHLNGILINDTNIF